MKLIPIQIECYAGAKADETPRRFSCGERLIQITEVVDRWHQVESQPEWPPAPIHEGRMLGGIGQVDGPRRPQLWLRL